MISRYEIFCKVMENGSFTKTAEELGYSQSAVSQAVRTLEQETETVLIDRKKDGIGLTADGEQYLPYFQQIYQAEKNLERKRRGNEGTYQQRHSNWNFYQCQPYLPAKTDDGI